MPDHIDPDDAKAVLRRAAELGIGDDGAPGIDRRSLTEAAAEVGIGPDAVGRALAEHDAGLLATETGRHGLLGPSREVVARVVPRAEAVTWAGLRRWLESQLLVRDERRGSVEVWRRRDDLGAKIRRKVDARISKRVRLGEVDALQVSTAPIGDASTVVRLEAVFDDMRRGFRTGLVGVPAAVTPVLGVCGALLTGEPAFAVGSVPLAGVLGGLGTYSARRALQDQRDAARKVLAGLLDDLEDA